MTHYDDAMSLRDARALYFEANGFGSDGGYSSKWVKIDFYGLPIAFPNVEARRRAVRLHDLHHLATGYDTDFPGEAEISAWEISTGCARYLAAWVLNFQGMFVGSFVAPKRVYRAFALGRRSRNLYREGFDEALLAERVGDLRERLVAGTDDAPRPGGLPSFALWWTLSGLCTLLSLGLILSPFAIVLWGVSELF